eukprot:6193998-Amphidinium_carterae.1
MIGEERAPGVQTIESSTTSSDSTIASTLMRRQEAQDDKDYWENIFDIMYEYFFDENEITSVQTLHEGVLYWMDKDEINDLERRAISKSKEDPEAERQYN